MGISAPCHPSIPWRIHIRQCNGQRVVSSTCQAPKRRRRGDRSCFKKDRKPIIQYSLEIISKPLPSNQLKTTPARPERSKPRFGVARRSVRNSWRSGEVGTTPSPSRGGLGWGWGKSGSEIVIGTHPPPDLPLEGGGATVTGAPLRRSPGKPPGFRSFPSSSLGTQSGKLQLPVLATHAKLELGSVGSQARAWEPADGSCQHIGYSFLWRCT
jgi:hypothetical protein